MSKRLNDCAYSILIPAYANCTLDDEQAARVEAHLSCCDSCCGTLAKAVDGGIVPSWLSSLAAAEEHATGHIDSASTDSNRVSLVAPLASNERYQKIRLLGQGGMGQVWQAWDSVMQRQVAIKQLRSDQRNDHRGRRLLQEAKSLAQLSHPNIVAVHEVLMLEDQPTLVMEFVDGPTLSNIARDFLMSERQAATLLERLADAVAHAHKQGVIHRDLKPSNILLHGYGQGQAQGQAQGQGQRYSEQNAIPGAIDPTAIKLTDFGLAKTFEGDELTRTGELLGTPAYMAPEQTIGLASVVGPQSDIYGLGAILYDLLTGTPPHAAENPLATMLLVREREPTTPRQLRPELSRDIETICLKCLQKIPKERYASAEELRDDLRAYLNGQSIRARPLGFVRTSIRWSRRHKSIVASAVLAISLVFTLLLGSLWTANKERQLRSSADDAKNRAELSQRQVLVEADRARRALEVNRQHFEVALDRINRLANMAYNPTNKTQSELDYNLEIRQATADIYATYLNTLPAPEQWTLDEAYAVTFYIKYMRALDRANLAEPWLERVQTVASKLEKQGPNSFKMREFLAQHYCNLQVDAYVKGDFAASGKYGEQAGRFTDVDARHAAYLLMNSALSYLQASANADAVRAANQSVQVYRSVLDGNDSKPEDLPTFLEKLRWHRHVARSAGNEEEAQKHIEEFERRAGQIDKSSPFFARVQETIKAFY